jgi:hypothetical protein
MGDTLSIIAIVLLLALVGMSLIKQRALRAESRTANETRTAGGEDQRERSVRRRAEARAARDAEL